MKASELKNEIKNYIYEILSEVDVDPTAGSVVMSKQTQPADIKKLTAQGIDVQLKEEDDDKAEEEEEGDTLDGGMVEVAVGEEDTGEQAVPVPLVALAIHGEQVAQREQRARDTLFLNRQLRCDDEQQSPHSETQPPYPSVQAR